MSNAEKAKPEIYLDLDRKRKFVLTMGALRTVEEKLGKSLFKLINWSDFGFKDISVLLWAGLLSEDPELTLEESDKLFDLETILSEFPKLRAIVETAIERAMPTLSDEDKEVVAKGKKKFREMVKA